MPEADSDRIYSEEEIAAVLKRAAALQGKRPRRVRTGLSLDEIRELAADSGIDPDLVDSAVREMEGVRDVQETNWWGGPMKATLVRNVEGRLSDETWEQVLSELRREFANTGTTEQRGSTRQWSIGQREGEKRAHMIATYRKGRTELELFWSEPSLAALYLTALIPSLVALPIVFEALELTGVFAFLVWLSIAVTFIAGARTLVAGVGNSRKRKLDALADRVQRLADENRVDGVADRETPADVVERGTATEADRAATRQDGEDAGTAPRRADGPYLQMPDDVETTSDPDRSDRRRTR